MNPVNWWHRQEGGKIAEERPAPPNADQPYPNLASVPAKPAPPDKDAMRKLTASLVADRTNQQHAAQAAPLADPSSPGSSPGLFGVGSAPPPPPTVASAPAPSGGATAGGEGGAASASMPAVNAPPAPPAKPPAPAPTKPVQSTPLEPPSGGVSSAPATPSGAAASGGTSSAAAASPPAAQPALPEGPPPRPAAAGAPRPPAPAPNPMPTQSSGTAASIVFTEGSSSLSQPAADEVKAFAGKRGNAVIAVTGYGDTPGGDPSVQSQALTLGLARAQAVFQALRDDGVPAEAIRVNAEASGRGASLRLLQ